MNSGRNVYLLDGCRSPIGRGHPEKGMYRDLRSDDLAAQTLSALLKRNPIESAQIDDIYLGCVGQHLEQGKNLARLVGLLAGLPVTVPGVTINRLCGSSLSALQMASDSICAGTNGCVIVGGVEHLGHVPMTAAVDYNSRLFTGAEFQWSNMGLTAEKLAEELSINRVRQDQYTLESNERYFRALESGFFEREVIPIALPDGATATRDEEPRRSSLEKLAELKPVFKDDGTVTAANSSGISDGACMAIICGEDMIRELGQEPLVRIIDTMTIGLDPTVMGLGPVYAIEKLMARNNMTIRDIDLFEINEAFAVQVLACREQLKIDSTRLNIHGGAVAMGHPLGMSGLRLAVTLSHSMSESKTRRGIASLCVGHGQGVAMLLERD